MFVKHENLCEDYSLCVTGADTDHVKVVKVKLSNLHKIGKKSGKLLTKSWKKKLISRGFIKTLHITFVHGEKCISRGINFRACSLS